MANIGQASQRYRKQIDVLNELFSFYKLPQKLYSKVRDHVETEFALTKGIDVASACSGLLVKKGWFFGGGGFLGP